MLHDMDEIQIEASVIANCIIYPDEAYNIVCKLEPNDFAQGNHQEIFRTIYDICRKGQTPQSIIVIDAVKKNDQEYLLEYINRITDDPAETVNVDYLIQRIKDNTSKVRLHQYSRDLYDNTQDPTKHIDEIITEHYDNLTKIIPKQQHISNASNSVIRFQEEWDELENSKSEFIGIESGLKGLDTLTRGFRKSSMVTIAAGTNVGKTQWALNMTVHNLLLGKSVLYFSLEMIDTELMRRILPMLITDENITIKEITENRIPLTKKPDLNRLLKKYSELNLTVDWGTKNVDKILVTCEQQKRTPKGLDLIVIDHLQLLLGANEPSLAANNTNKIKNYALVNQIPILTVSQFNRLSAARQDKLPQLSDLKGSGAIEQDSDTIIFLHKDKPTDSHMTMICRKHRQATQAVNFNRELVFDSKTGRLVEQLSMNDSASFVPKKPYKNTGNPYTDVDF